MHFVGKDLTKHVLVVYHKTIDESHIVNLAHTSLILSSEDPICPNDIIMGGIFLMLWIEHS